jgi:photosystem II stability/assembly factor-like uncharacterized protein
LEADLPVTITAVEMLDSQTGWAAWEGPDFGLSGFLLRTTDGGQTWQEVTPPSGYPIQSRFFALDALHAWAIPAMTPSGQEVEAGFIWRTTDGGQTWQVSLPLSPELQGEPALLESFLPQAIFFLDEMHGWIVISVGHYMNQDVNVIFGTQDGGLTWNNLADKFSMGQGEGQDGGAGMPCQVTGITFVDLQHGFLAGNCLAVGVDENWNILVTDDGGDTWQEQALPEPSGVPQALQQAANTQNRICAASGVDNTPAGILVLHSCLLTEGSGMQRNYFFLSLSSDHGQTWKGWAGEVASFVDASTGYSLGDLQQDGTRLLSVTSDGGATWQELRQVSWPGAHLDFTAIETGFALAWDWNPSQQNYDYALVQTTDGGSSWKLVEGVVK